MLVHLVLVHVHLVHVQLVHVHLLLVQRLHGHHIFKIQFIHHTLLCTLSMATLSDKLGQVSSEHR